MDASESDDRNTLNWTRLDSISFSAIGLLTLVLRLIGLTEPPDHLFDEAYYVPDACLYVYPGDEACGTAREVNFDHPPLGKWLIGLGQAIFGHNEFGWRIMSVVAGTAIVLLVYVVAKKMLGSTVAATVAATLLSLDLMHFVMSRTGMLDIFLSLFGLGALAAVAFDRDAVLAGRTKLRERPWRAVAGALCGAAIATKWSGVSALGAAIAVTVAWEMAAHAPTSRRVAFLRVIRTTGAGMLVCFLVLPALIYASTYIGRIQEPVVASPTQESSWLNELGDRQTRAFNGLAGNSYASPFMSPPWSWLLLKRGFHFRLVETDDGVGRQVLNTGSPVAWWIGIPVLLFLTGAWLRRNRAPYGFILAGFYWNYLPWFLLWVGPSIWGSTRALSFIFYALPMLPFMYLAFGAVAALLWERTSGRALVTVYLAAVVAAFSFYYPVLTYRPLSHEAWNARIWIFDNCERKGPAPLRQIKIRTVDGTPTTRIFENGRQLVPPSGWCWIQRIGLETATEFST